MNWLRISSGAALILVVILSTYFGAVAAAPKPGAVGPSLTVYQLGSEGQVVGAASSLFEAGAVIGVAVPQAASPPYILTVTSLSGLLIWSQKNSSLPKSGLFSVSLTPALFPPGASYIISLQVTVFYSPGFSSPQTSISSFTVVPALASMQLKSSSFMSNMFQAQMELQDPSSNPLSGVRLGLFLVRGNSSLLVTTEKTDLLGRSTLGVGESLAGGTYQFQVRVLDGSAVFAAPAQLPSISVNYIPTVLAAWTPVSGNVQSRLARSDNQAPVKGRLLILEQRLADGNWTVASQAYSDDSGQALFDTNTTKTLRVSFNGDNFFSVSRSLVSTATTPTTLSSSTSGTVSAVGLSRSSDSFLEGASPLSSTFVGNSFSNGHITMKIEPSTSTIYDSHGQAVLGHLSWSVQFKDSAGAWQTLAWDEPFSLGMDDPVGYHRVTLTGTAGNGQVAVSMSFVAKPQDLLFTPIRMPVDVEALNGSHSYRMVWHLDGVSASFFQFEQRTGDQRTIVRGPVMAGARIDQSPSGEDSMVALAADGKTVLLGLNWDNALRYYQGASLSSGVSGASANIQFGDVALSGGEHWIIPACPCPDGGGGGGGPVSTSTTLSLPSSAYATISTVLMAQVIDQFGGAVPSSFVNFYSDGSFIGSAQTNTTGYASLAWTPGVSGSHAINATFIGNCCDSASSTVQFLTINQTPTTTQILTPQSIAYSWDLYYYYQSICSKCYGLPIVVPVNILTLAPSGSGAPANIYTPKYSGSSVAPTTIAGYGWAGLNLTSTVTLTFNGTWTQAQNMNWTRNFYLPPCPTPLSCSTTPRNGHMYLTASLAPPSTLYSASSSSLNIPYQNVNSLSSAPGQVTQIATPPRLYVNVNATYPYISANIQSIPVALAAYTAYLAYSLGGPLGSTLSGGYTIYSLSVPTDFVQVCSDSACTSPAANIAVYLYNSGGVYCGVNGVTDNRGVASIGIPGTTSTCTLPYYYAAIYTSGTTLRMTELFRTEAVSSPSPFFTTNFQGYNYATYAPQRTGRYLLHMFTFFLNSPYTILYPSTNYPDVQYPYLACCDVFLTVLKHPLQAQASFNPGTTTVLSKTNATIQLGDLATSKPLSTSSLNYTLTRTAPSPGTALSGSLTTNVNGTAVLSLGLLAYGNYTLTVTRSATSTLNGLSSNFNITVYKALPTLILRDVSSIASFTLGNLITSDTTGIIKLANPLGTAGMPAIVHSQASPYEFYEIIAGTTDVSSAFITVYYYSSCPSCVQGSSGQVVSYSWAGGPRNGTIACAQPAFTTCSYSLTRLTGISNICATSYCYKFSVFAGPINALPVGWYLNLALGACVNSNTNCTNDCANTACSINCPVGKTFYCVWGNLDNPDGSFLVNGASVRHSDLNAPVGSAVRFQFNATSSPNSITEVDVSIFNQTTSTSKFICLIGGGTGCLQPSQTTTGSFLLYSPSTFNFGPGNYVLSVTVRCPGCVQTTFEVLYLDLVVSQSSWSENGVVLSQYIYETSLINNATNTQIAVAGLAESIYINGVLYATLLTDANGNAAFLWKPSTAGQYMIKAVFQGQNYYTNSSTTIMVSVTLRNVVLAANNSPQNPSVGRPVTWNVYARDMVNNNTVTSLPVSLFINGANTTAVSTDSTGYAIFTYNFTSRGAYNVTFVSATTSLYNSATTRNPMTVFMDTTVTLPGGTVILGQQNSFVVTLKDPNGSPLPNRVVQIQINGASYANLTTNSSGQAQFTWQPQTTGSYTVVASFSATGTSDTGYRPSSASVIVSVMPQTTTNTSSTSSGTQSVTLNTAQGSAQPPPSSFSVSVSFPSIGWLSLDIQLSGRSLHGSLHVWNEFGASCVASVFGVCVLVAPWWHVHFDAISNLLSFSYVTDFLTGTILSQFLSANAVWVAQGSGAFQNGQATAQTLIGAATAAYTVGRIAEGGVDDSLGTTAAAAVWFGGATGALLGDFLVYKDKQSELNFLGGMVTGFGLSAVLKLFSITVINNLVSYVAWSAYWLAYELANPYSKPVLFFSALTVVFGIYEIFELESSM